VSEPVSRREPDSVIHRCGARRINTRKLPRAAAQE
jgi:hypothetical protein